MTSLRWFIFLLCTLLCAWQIHALASICPGSTGDPSNLACWDFNSRYEVIQPDLSGNNNTVVLEGEAEWATGVHEWALQLDSQQYGIVQSLGSNGFEAGDFSLSVWVRASNDNELIFSLAKANPQNSKIYVSTILEIQGGKLFFGQVENINSNKIDGVESIDLGTVLTSWHNIVALKEGGDFRLFVNAVDVTSQEASVSLGNIDRHSLSQAFYIGGVLGNNYKQITLDEMSLWNRALSFQEIDSIYKANVNGVPQFKSTPDTLTLEENLYQYAIVVSDPDNDPISLELITAPNGMILSRDTLFWTPDDPNLGNHPIRIHAKDNKGGTEVQQYSLRVQNVNDKPKIKSSPSLIAAQDLPYQYQLVIEDPDPNDSEAFEIISGPPEMQVSSNGLLSWTPTSAQLGDNLIRLKVSDLAGAADTQSFTLKVTSGNAPPSVTTTSLKEAVEDVLYSDTLLGTDPEGASLSWMLLEGPEGLTLSDYGILSFTPVDSQTGSSSVVVEASDGIYNDTGRYSLNILPVNDPPVIASSVPNAKVYRADSSYVIPLDAIDEEGAGITWSLELAPAGAQIVGSALNWRPSTQQEGLDTMLIIASDGENRDTLTHIVLVLGPLSVSTQFDLGGSPDVRVHFLDGHNVLFVSLPRQHPGDTQVEVYNTLGRLTFSTVLTNPGEHLIPLSYRTKGYLRMSYRGRLIKMLSF